jgi:hypothetical protein
LYNRPEVAAVLSGLSPTPPIIIIIIIIIIYPQALGSVFIAFYDSQGYGGDIL